MRKKRQKRPYHRLKDRLPKDEYQLLRRFLSPLIESVERFGPVFEHAHVRPSALVQLLPLNELYLAARALLLKGAAGHAAGVEHTLISIIRKLEGFTGFSFDVPTQEDGQRETGEGAHNTSGVSPPHDADEADWRASVASWR